MDRSVRNADAVMFSNNPLFGCVGSSLVELGGVKLFGVDGLEETVTESLNNIAGALASGVSGRTYGTSGCREYGNTGNTVITPFNQLRHDSPQERKSWEHTSCTCSFTST